YNTIDTLDGSSGAGILDAVTGKLVGIHTNGGCTNGGDGENYGVTVGALIGASKIVRGAIDSSRDFLVGDWNGDGISDLAVFVDGCLYPDADHDEVPDVGGRLCPADPTADQYFVGHWHPGGPSQLGWRRGNCVFLDENPSQPLCFEGPFEVLIANWDDDDRSDLGIRRGPCIDFDTNLDGAFDGATYCFGNGVAQDEYLVGHWDGTPRESIAVRKGNIVSLDVDRNGSADPFPLVYGDGGNADQYLVGDWYGDGRSELAVRTGTSCSIQVPAGFPEQKRNYRDFWTKP